MPEHNETLVKHDSRIHSATDTRYRFTLHVPTCDNAGNDIDPALIADVESQLRRTFGAFTRTEAVGVWTDNEITYSDPQYLYAIDAPSDQHGFVLRTIAVRVRDDLGQLCVYVTRQTIDTWLV